MIYSERSPIKKGKIRNTECPYYNSCLDFVIKKGWDTWACDSCGNASTKDIEYSLESPHLEISGETTLNYPLGDELERRRSEKKGAE